MAVKNSFKFFITYLLRTKFLINGDYQNLEEIVKRLDQDLLCSHFKYKTWYETVMCMKAQLKFLIKIFGKILFEAFTQIQYLTSISNTVHFVFIIIVIKYKENVINIFT